MISPTASSTEASTTGFSIEMNASMFSMLTRNVYNDVILAPIREWSTNALDSCIAAGIDPHFDVHLPTISEPTFAVRDYGTGLPESDILGLFSVLGASTKRNSNAYNGTFGIGRMSGLAYSSSFTVESFYNGQYFSYLITVKDGIPGHIKLSESSTSEPNGLRLSLAVDARDISKFIEKATFLYRFFNTRPTCNIELSYSDPVLANSNWALYPDLGYNTYVVMANVPYRLNNTPIKGCVITIPTGSVSITPGRETLTYDVTTERYLEATLATVLADLKATALASCQALPTLFEQVVALATANNAIPSFKAYPSDLGSTGYFNSRSFTLQGTSTVTPISMSRYSSKAVESYYCDWAYASKLTHILIQDVPSNFVTLASSALESASVSESQLMLRPSSNTKGAIELLLADYPAYLAGLGLSHLPVLFLSTFVTATTKATTVKLAQTTFQPSDIDGGKRPTIDLSTCTGTYYYFLETPSNPILYSYLESLLKLKFLVLPKKVHSIISSYSNFIPITDTLLQSLLDPLTFSVVDASIIDLNNVSYYLKTIPSNFFHFKSLYDFTDKAPKCWSYQVAYIHAHSTLRVNTLTYTHPVTVDHIHSVYPELATTFKSCYTPAYVRTYITLQDQIHALHSASGLPSPIVPATSDYPSPSSLLPSPQSQSISS